MVQIDDVIVSFDIFKEKFYCDINACKGECCIEGDAGAPLESKEVELLEKVLPAIWDDLSDEAKDIINKQGVCIKTLTEIWLLPSLMAKIVFSLVMMIKAIAYVQ